MVLGNLGKSLTNAVNRIISRGPVDKAQILELKNEVFKILLTADIRLQDAKILVDTLERRALTEKPPAGITRKDAMIHILYQELTRIMGTKTYPLNIHKKQVNKLMLVGIQGSGKTTTVGKLALYFKHEHWNMGLVCTDTWRPGAFDQLKQLGDRIGIEVYGEPQEKNAVKIAQRGIKYFEEKEKNLILVDTAGRHKEESELIKEMKDLEKKIHPNEIILVLDGTIGQKAYEQASQFAEATDVGSIIVTKLDGTAKGGGAISAAAATRAPIKFIGLGEDLEELEKFDPKGFAGRILGLGDLSGIIEQVERAQITTDEERAREMMKGHISFSDMLDMFGQMNKMGGIRKLIDKMPGGLSHNVDDNMLDMSKDSMKRFQNIILSMTPDERDGRIKLNKSRIERIARGSGVEVDKVKELVNQKKMSEKWIKQMMNMGKRRGRGPNQTGFPFNMAGLMG